MRTELYRAFDFEGRLLYVGISFSAIGRLWQHRNRAEWFSRATQVKIENYPTRDAALAAETNAIKTEKPLFNVIGTKIREESDSQQAVREQKDREIRFRKAQVYTDQGFDEHVLGGGLSVYEIFGPEEAQAAWDRELIFERICYSKTVEGLKKLALRAHQIMDGTPHYERGNWLQFL